MSEKELIDMYTKELRLSSVRENVQLFAEDAAREQWGHLTFLRRLLEVEAAAALASLQQEERETMQKLELNHEALIQQSRVLWRMIAELEERSQRPVRWMLQVRSRFSWKV